MLRDIVLDTIAAAPDMAVVGVVDGAAVEREVQRTGATIVIVDANSEHAGGARASLLQGGARAPGVIALTSDGRHAFAQIALGDLSPERLAHTLRQLPTIRFDD